MALDALCAMPQRSFRTRGNHGGLRNGLPPVADFEKEFEDLQLTGSCEADPMQIIRPPFVSYYIENL